VTINPSLAAAGLAITFGVNIVAGYWRAYAKRVGSRLEWILAVHAPVPLVALLRRAAGAGLSGPGLYLLAAFIAAYFAGQRVGGMIHSVMARRLEAPGRFLLRDLAYVLRSGSPRAM